jgi:hypothetical protein
LRIKILRYVIQPEIRITGLSLCGSSLQCGGVFTGWPPAMLPGPSKGSQPYDPKSRGDIYWPKYKGPGPVLVIF